MHREKQMSPTPGGAMGLSTPSSLALAKNLLSDTTTDQRGAGAFKRRGTRLVAALDVPRKIKAAKDNRFGHCTLPADFS